MNRAALSLTAVLVAVALAVYPRPASAQSSRPACVAASANPSCTLGVAQSVTVTFGRTTANQPFVAVYHPTLSNAELCAAVSRSAVQTVATANQVLHNCGAESATSIDSTAPAVSCNLSSLAARCTVTITGVPAGGWVDVVTPGDGTAQMVSFSSTPHPTTTTTTTSSTTSSTTSTTTTVPTTSTTIPSAGSWADGPEGDFRVGVAVALALLVFASFARVGMDA